MRLRIARLLPLGVLFGLAACSAPPPAPAPPPFKPVGDMRTLMIGIIDPAADVVWDSVGAIVTAAGTEERRPRTAEEWTHVRNSALIVAEAGNLLMMPARARDNGDWMTMSRAMIDAAEEAVRAAEAKDADAIFAVGDQIYESCAACHTKYIATKPAS